MSDLHDALTEISGVGDATAEKIIEIVEEHDTGESRLLEKAIERAEAGDDRAASLWLRRCNAEE